MTKGEAMRFTRHLARVCGGVLLASAMVVAGAQGAAARPRRNCYCTAYGTSTPQPIVFASDRTGDMDIYSMNPDGSNLRRLTSTPGFDGQPSWSKDRTKIAFVTRRNPYVGGQADLESPGGSALFIMNADGTGQSVVRNVGNAGKFRDPSLSPDGSKVAHTVEYVDSNGNVSRWIELSHVGGGLVGFGNLPQGMNFQPKWSPDGSKIAFVNYDPSLRRDDVWVMNANGSGKKRVISSGREPAWSPDGTKIAFTRTMANYKAIFWQTVGSSVAPTQVTSASRDDFRPSWAPDGSKILFTSMNINASPGSYDLAQVQPDGTYFFYLFGNTTASDVDPDWGYPAPVSEPTRKG